MEPRVPESGSLSEIARGGGRAELRATYWVSRTGTSGRPDHAGCGADLFDEAEEPKAEAGQTPGSSNHFLNFNFLVSA
ncbi:MAG: hypothetical protein RLZ45_272 [Verrucomicrobiota bacterium]|jgi:hypothetical protein